MREVDVSSETAIERVTVLSYGGLRSGKTRFLSSFPRPLVLADSTESGWTTIASVIRRAPDLLFEPGVAPIVWAIEHPNDLLAAYPKIEALIARGQVLTVGLDSITFFANLKLAALKGRTGNFDPRQHYGELADFLVYVRQMLHQLPVNIVWTALDSPPDSDNPRGMPLIPGRTAKEFGGACDYVLYHRSLKEGWEIRTRSFGTFSAGGRDEGALPDPLGFYTENDKGPEHPPVFTSDCTYKTFAEWIGLGLPKTAK